MTDKNRFERTKYIKLCETHGTGKMMYNLFTHLNRMGKDQIEMSRKIVNMERRISNLEVELSVHKYILQKHGILKEDK